VADLALHTQGELDTGFGTAGTSTTSMSSAGGTDEVLWNLDVQRDGKIVAAGDAMTAGGGMDVALARFNSDGTLDASFGTAGKVTTAIGPGTRGDRAFDVKVLPDGKILVAGFADLGPGAGGRNVMLARFEANGTLDASFGGGGIVITAVAPGDNRDQVGTNGLALDPRGRVVVVGAANVGAGAGGFNVMLARYLPNGTLDAAFDGDGIATTAIAPGDNFDTAISVAIDASGRIVTGGVSQPGDFPLDWALARYNADGTFDPSFGTGGVVTTNLGPATPTTTSRRSSSSRPERSSSAAPPRRRRSSSTATSRWRATTPTDPWTAPLAPAALSRRTRPPRTRRTRSTPSRSRATRRSSSPASAIRRRLAATSA
jgi:uncharacterized delta-60 repeat protein